MSAPHDTIKGYLIELVDGMKTADTPKMLRNMEQLDACVTAHRAQIDPRLAHFLERRSYVKALDFLADAPDIPSGSCGPTRRAE